ncbi:flagellar protein FlgN [Paenibacillus sp. GYB006]|uniref:flagellar protein FlgN n=1 Tax=Paenibacillus sp. GYB006 TaxID=2994394 RepID=UPI002F96657E
MSLNQLIDAMYELETTHREMLRTAEVKKESIIKNDTDTLIRLLNQESVILKRIQSQEVMKNEAIVSFLLERGIKSKLNLTITEISRLVFDVEDKERLQQAQMALSTTLLQLKEMNEINQKLLEHSLAFIDYSLDVLIDKPTMEPVYKHPDQRQGAVGQFGYFDSRA